MVALDGGGRPAGANIRISRGASRKTLLQRERRATKRTIKARLKTKLIAERHALAAQRLAVSLDGVLAFKKKDVDSPKGHQHAMTFQAMLRAAMAPTHVGLKVLQETTMAGQLHFSSVARARRRIAVSIYEITKKKMALLSVRLFQSSLLLAKKLHPFDSDDHAGNVAGIVWRDAHADIDAPLVASINCRFDGTPHPVTVKRSLVVTGRPAAHSPLSSAAAPSASAPPSNGPESAPELRVVAMPSGASPVLEEQGCRISTSGKGADCFVQRASYSYSCQRPGFGTLRRQSPPFSDRPASQSLGWHSPLPRPASPRPSHSPWVVLLTPVWPSKLERSGGQ